MMTCGNEPYPGMDEGKVLNKLEAGYRMPSPNGCPEKLYDIMMKCWRKDATNRPIFMIIYRKLIQICYLNEAI